MGFFSRLPFAKKRNLSVQEAFGEMLLGSAGRTKAPISPDIASKVAAVHACKLAISESIAMLPGTVYDEQDDADRIKQKDHWLTRLLRDGPSDIVDPFVYMESQQLNVLDYGNAYSFIERDRIKQPAALVPLLPERMKVDVSPGNNLAYLYRDPKTNQEKEYDKSNIFHLRYHSRDGILGRSPLAVAGESIRGAYSLLEHLVNFFDNGAFNSGFLKVPFDFEDDEQRKTFVDSFKKYFGTRNAGSVALLEKSADWVSMMQNMQQAQFAELRALSVLDIAMIYRMPPHMIQYLKDGASYSSIEQQSINFVTYTIQPWVTRWEMALRKQLLLDEDPTYYVKFNVDALVRGDLASRTAAIVSQMQYGLKTLNEGRALFELNKIDDPLADEPMVSHNLRPLKQLQKELDKPDAPAPDAKPADPAAPPADDQAARFMPLFDDAEARIEKREDELLKYAVRNHKSIDEIEKSYQRFTDSAAEILSPIFVAAGIDLIIARDFLEGYSADRVSLVRSQGASVGVPKRGMKIGELAGKLMSKGERHAA